MKEKRSAFYVHFSYKSTYCPGFDGSKIYGKTNTYSTYIAKP